jgi:hypothetical protein
MTLVSKRLEKANASSMIQACRETNHSNCVAEGDRAHGQNGTAWVNKQHQVRTGPERKVQ